MNEESPAATAAVIVHHHPSYNNSEPTRTISYAPPSYDISACNWGCLPSEFSAPPTFHDMPSIDSASYGNEIPSLNYQPIVKYEDVSSIYPQEEDIKPSKEEILSRMSDESVKVDNCCDTSDSEIIPMVKRGRPTENPCWSYFIRLDDQLVKCRICTKTVKSACATNMTKHLERHHSGDYEKLSEQIRNYRLQDSNFRKQFPQLSHMNPPDIQQTTTTANETVYQSSSGFDSQYYDHTGQPFYPNFEENGQWHLSHFWHNPSGSEAVASTSDFTTTAAPSNIAPVNNPVKPKPRPTIRNIIAERPYMKRNRKTEHPVWEYFKRTDDGNALCAICSGIVKSPCSSNFMRHLMRHHSYQYNDVYIKWVQKRNVTNATAHSQSDPLINNEFPPVQ